MTKSDRIDPTYRKKLLAQLKKINPKTIVKISSRPIRVSTAGDHFSDWHDRFRDNGTFTDAWGRSPSKNRIQGLKRSTPVKRTAKRR